MNRVKLITQMILVLAILVVINLISSNLYFRLDFTEDDRYTLSPATKSILSSLDDVISVKAYFTAELPPQLLSAKQDFEDLLIEYETLSDGNVTFEFINPNESQTLETEAQEAGVRPVIVNVTESDQVKQLRAYMGAVIQSGEETEIIPLIQPGSSMEFDLTTTLKKITVLDKPKVALLQGHGEPNINALMQLRQQLSVLYDIEPFTLTDSTNFPSFYKALLIIHPTDTIEDWEFEKIDSYLAGNGSLFVAYNGMSGNLNQGVLTEANDIGLKRWLGSKGIVLGNQFLIDANAASITVQQQQGPFIVNSQIQFPYFPIISTFSDHPVSKGLESLVLPLVGPITLQTDSSIVASGLATSSENSGLVSAPAYIDINKEWTLGDFREEPQNVAVALEGPVVTNAHNKVVVINNGSFIVNGEGQQIQQLNADNVNFASNAIDWLTDDTGLIDLRTKGVTNRPLKQLEDSERAFIKYGNVFGPILLLLIYAFIRKQRYQRKKQNWLQGNY